MPKYFGTDGIRAVAGEFPLTKDFVTKLGYCALKEIEKTHGAAGRARRVIIAEDSRKSGPELSSYLEQGILAAGFEAMHIGIAPTPAVSYLVREENAICGIVISASHNPAEFNGIKFFAHNGKKLNEDIESAIEGKVEALASVPAAPNSAKVTRARELIKKYTAFLKDTVPAGIDFKNTKVVLDCANGAAYKIAPLVFKELGIETVVIFDKPTGLNINDGAGALHTETMQKTVRETGAFIGFSFDGDADRLIAADEEGTQLDGDNIIAAAALSLKEKGRLKGSKVALTVMANLGLINFLKQNGVKPVLTAVGDKYVFEALEKEDLSLGGETSGHIIFRDIAATGDGILCALQLLAIIKQTGGKASFLKKQWRKYPLKLIPVKVNEKVPLDEIEGFCAFVKKLEEEMGGKGRIFVRYSGTEPLLRILVEGEDKKQVERIAKQTEDFYKAKVK
jgi:phosphoglucosamine mutase